MPRRYPLSRAFVLEPPHEISYQVRRCVAEGGDSAACRGALYGSGAVVVRPTPSRPEPQRETIIRWVTEVSLATGKATPCEAFVGEDRLNALEVMLANEGCTGDPSSKTSRVLVCPPPPGEGIVIEPTEIECWRSQAAMRSAQEHRLFQPLP